MNYNYKYIILIVVAIFVFCYFMKPTEYFGSEYPTVFDYTGYQGWERPFNMEAIRPPYPEYYSNDCGYGFPR